MILCRLIDNLFDVFDMELGRRIETDIPIVIEEESKQESPFVNDTRLL